MLLIFLPLKRKGFIATRYQGHRVNARGSAKGSRQLGWLAENERLDAQQLSWDPVVSSSSLAALGLERLT
jgi:hypothetical protein